MSNPLIGAHGNEAFRDEFLIRRIASEEPAVGVEDAEEPNPLGDGWVVGFEDYLRPKSPCPALVFAFGALVRVLNQFGARVFVWADEKMTMRGGLDGTREIITTIGEELSLMDEYLELGKDIPAICGGNVSLGHAPESI